MRKREVFDAALRLQALDQDRTQDGANLLLVAFSGGLGRAKQKAVLEDLRRLYADVSPPPARVIFGDPPYGGNAA